VRDADRFQAWLDRILVDRCRDLARADRRQVRTVQIQELDGVVSQDPATGTERSVDLLRAP
jgi:hypothetical protein